MCGFAGFYVRKATSSFLLEEMTRAIAHRGPDDERFYAFNDLQKDRTWKQAKKENTATQLGLGFRRLSIIDLSDSGSQPMSTEDGRFQICFNGEIYNYIELRNSLKNHKFQSQSDTEVLLTLLAQNGTDALSRLNGIFSIALWDRKERMLTLARDAFGVKPLYYFSDERGLFFASEIRSLIIAAKSRPTLNKPLLQRYLLNGWICEPDTLFEGIYKLEPGTLLKIDRDIKIHKHEYWDLTFKSIKRPKETLLSQLDSTLTMAVDRQMRSDVPIAFFLSGGVDSSLLAVEALKVRKNPISTYTIGFKWNHSQDDQLDVKYASFLANKFGFEHHEILLEPSITTLLPKVVEVLEEPLSDAAALCSYLICEAASKKYKVLISGQGGDELFGGYPVYRAGVAAYMAQKLPRLLLQLANLSLKRLPYSVLGQRIQTIHRLKKLSASVLNPWPEPFCWLRSAFGQNSMAALMTPELLEIQADPFQRQKELLEKTKDLDPIQQLLYIDTKTYLPSLNLAYTDKTSMHHSMEVRVPLLDLEIADLCTSIPSYMKVSTKQDKWILKALAEKILPSQLVHRKKSGFGLPLRDWFLKDLQPMSRELLSAERLRKQKLFNSNTVSSWLDEHQKLKADHSSKIYSLISLQLWLEQFKISI